MRSAGAPEAPEAPVRLVTGADASLTWLRRALAAVAVLGMAQSFWPTWARLLGVIAVITVLALAERRERGHPSCTLTITVDGHAQLDGTAFRLGERGWLTAAYCVLKLRNDAGTTRPVLISASKQDGDEYRKLLAWMRLRPWRSG